MSSALPGKKQTNNARVNLHPRIPEYKSFMITNQPSKLTSELTRPCPRAKSGTARCLSTLSVVEQKTRRYDVEASRLGPHKTAMPGSEMEQIMLMYVREQKLVQNGEETETMHQSKWYTSRKGADGSSSADGKWKRTPGSI